MLKNALISFHMSVLELDTIFFFIKISNFMRNFYHIMYSYTYKTLTHVLCLWKEGLICWKIIKTVEIQDKYHNKSMIRMQKWTYPASSDHFIPSSFTFSCCTFNKFSKEIKILIFRSPHQFWLCIFTVGLSENCAILS